MTRRIATRSGALYFIDDLEGIWHRIRGGKSERMRSETGVFIRCIIGDRIILHCPPFDAAKPELERIIVSSVIESIETVL
jgi:hypothetical protein